MQRKKIILKCPFLIRSNKYIPHRWKVLLAYNDWLIWKWLATTIHLKAAEETKSCIKNLNFNHFLLYTVVNFYLAAQWLSKYPPLFTTTRFHGNQKFVSINHFLNVDNSLPLNTLSWFVKKLFTEEEAYQRVEILPNNTLLVSFHRGTRNKTANNYLTS